MLRSIDRVVVEEDYCKACSIVVQIQSQHPLHTCSGSMDHQDRSIQLHFGKLLLCMCILMSEMTKLYNMLKDFFAFKLYLCIYHSNFPVIFSLTRSSHRQQGSCPFRIQ